MHRALQLSLVDLPLFRHMLCLYWAPREHTDFCMSAVNVRVNSKCPSREKEVIFYLLHGQGGPERAAACALVVGSWRPPNSTLTGENRGPFPNQDQQSSSICRSLRLTRPVSVRHVQTKSTATRSSCPAKEKYRGEPQPHPKTRLLGLTLILS